ncbi:diguanylate cyclase domain-containing protein [Ideonella sp. BN130291]|uniref:diguanylate cyclase domain-containing protein n=1 Tax=Ideonella sp. BN130291 TaxID=3112940 RepID=UPI002E26BAAE|nr:diguanylate cyclase [Ideonella sp. BN130291]
MPTSAPFDLATLLRGLDRSDLGIALYDPQGERQYANRAFQARHPGAPPAQDASLHETHFDGWRLVVDTTPPAATAQATPAPAPADEPVLRRAADAVAEARARHRPFTLSLVMLDEAADLPTLHRFARHCQGHLRPGDHLALRPQGELLLLLPGAGAHMAASVIQRLRYSLRLQPAAGGHADPHTTFCAGLAELSDGEDVDALLQRARQALATARRKGRNSSALAPPP